MEIIWSVCCIAFIISVASLDIDTRNCDGFATRGNGITCYKVQKIKDTFENSRAICRNLGMDLTSIVSEAENEVVLKVMSSSTLSEVWINMNISLTTWRWPDDTELKEQGCFSGHNSLSFHENKPNDNSFLTCSKTCAGKKYVGLMDGFQCFCGDSLGRNSQSGALCHTACPLTSTENCGGNYSQRIVAIDGVYSNWLFEQPNNVGTEDEIQMCAILEENLKWNDVGCQGSYPAICEINLSPEYFPTCEVTESGIHLIKTPLSETCIYVTKTSASYFKAVQECANFNGSLIQIPSAEFTKALQQVVKPESSYWIGATRFKQVWLSGEKVTYTDWQPFNLKYDSGYGYIKRTDPSPTSRTWAVAYDSDKKFIICESSNSTIPYVPSYFVTTTTTTSLPPTKLIVSPPSTTLPTLPPVNFTSPRGKQNIPVQEVPDLPPEVRSAITGGVVTGGLLIIIIAVVIIVVICKKKRESPILRDVEGVDRVQSNYFFGTDLDYGTMTPKGSMSKTNLDTDSTHSSSPPPPYS